MKKPLDRIDFEILQALQKDGRLSNKELAAKVGLAPSTCFERVRRLTESGAVRGFHAEIDRRALGIGLEAMIAVRLEDHTRAHVDSFRAHALSVAEVVAIYHVTGNTDFLIHVAVRDSDHLRDLALDAFTTRPEVAHIETSLIFEGVRTGRLPRYGGGE